MVELAPVDAVGATLVVDNFVDILIAAASLGRPWGMRPGGSAG
jgi:hypothetical protein